MFEMFQSLLDLLNRGEDAVLVTVASAQGSTPRGAGSQLLAGREGLVAGTIGGGPGEAQALALAEEVLEKRGTAVRRLELRHGGELDSVCGGEQTVLLQFVPRDAAAWRTLAREVLARLEAHRGGGLVLETGADPALLEETPSCPVWDGRRLTLPLPVGERVVIFGGGHCALALVPVLRSVGFRVAVFDDRPEFASAERFPEAETVVCHSYTDIAAGLELTAEDYAVVMTSGHSHDFEVEEQLLRRPLAYVGVMGSRTKTAYVNGKLREAGVPEDAISRVHTPIGAAIKAVTPEEIAVSVTGELIYERALRREAAGEAAHGCPSHL
ncbi:XdhC/CoxI family protein [uncultured Oscillibacter sp.]|uniref:XdhC family protein n=1 Tax=uncultured Oscillibacter sp. TaxID=876091 RepID=UPI0025F26481|nr:XdhC/CoxI family protein [uncultured Oscillibacter sp.]